MSRLLFSWARAATIFLILQLASSSLDTGKLSVERVDSKSNVPGGYLRIRGLNYTDNIVPQQSPCIDIARRIREPYTSRYWRRISLDELKDQPPLAFSSWNGTISEETFRSTVSSGKAHYKIIGHQVYVKDNSVDPRFQVRAERIEEMLQFTAYLYPLPDMEFYVHYHDGCVPGVPLLTFSGCRQFPNRFVLPSYSVWNKALGPTQMTAYHACLRERYPAKDRIPKVVWRGSTTGHMVGPTLEKCMQLLRVRLHMLARDHQDIMDVAITSLVQMCTDILKPVITDFGSRISGEDANKYCVILDVDGNSWSDRYAGSILHFPTPILKQSSNFTGYIEHFFAPGVAIEEFDPSFDGLVDTVKRMIEDCKKGDRSEGQALARRSQALAQLFLDHAGVARSMAYLLLEYKRVMPWSADPSLVGWSRLSRRPCCKFVFLPPEVVEDMSRAL